MAHFHAPPIILNPRSTPGVWPITRLRQGVPPCCDVTTCSAVVGRGHAILGGPQGRCTAAVHVAIREHAGKRRGCSVFLRKEGPGRWGFTGFMGVQTGLCCYGNGEESTPLLAQYTKPVFLITTNLGQRIPTGRGTRINI